MSEDEGAATLPARRNEDELSGEVSIRAKIDQSGLDVGGRSRALAAVDMLLGGVIGWPATAMESLRRRTAIKGQVREEALRIEGRKSLELLRDMPSIGAAAADRFVRDQIHKQENREAVWIETEEALKALPPPSPQQDGASEASNSGAEDLDPDWLNRFARLAEDATSDDLRKVWGRVLAGEIRNPKSFSLATLRVLSELDGSTARLFEKWASLRVGSWIPKPITIDSISLMELTRLEEAGLIQEANGTISSNFSADENGAVSFFSRDYGCHLKLLEGKGNISLPVIIISRAGSDIASILPDSEISALQKVVQRFEGDKVIDADKSKLLRVVKREGKSVTATEFPFPRLDLDAEQGSP